MSDTPRTLQEECYGTCWAACERIEELEAQVRAAANHINRLEEAGDALKAAGYFGGWADAVNNWIKAKEAKP